VISFPDCLKKFPINPAGSNWIKTLTGADLFWFSTEKVTVRRFFAKCGANIVLAA
jgi:hypothetical protein